MKQAIIFVECNTSGTGVLFFQKAIELGYEPVLLAKNKSFYRFCYAVTTYQVDTENVEQIMVCLSQLRSQYEIKGIWTTSEYYTVIVAKVAKKLKLPAASPEATGYCRNKFTQRELLSKNGFQTPWYYKIYSVNELVNLEKALNYPCIIKPVDSSGSTGVKLCYSIDELREMVTVLTNSPINERGIKQESYVLIEEYIQGEEFSVEILNGKVIGFTKKYLGKLPHFVETGHDFPYFFQSDHHDLFKQEIERLIHTFGLTFGPLHIEFRIKNDQLYVIEINARLAGGYIPQIILCSYGIDAIELTLRTIIGEKAVPVPDLSLYSSIRFIMAEKCGIYAGYTQKTKTSKAFMPNEIAIYKNIGNEISINNDFRDRIGHVIATNPVQSEAIKMAEECIRDITLKIK